MTRILIAEDSDVVALLLQAIVEAEPDMRVVGRARDGREAVHLARHLRPDLITMDIRMPFIDGFEATRMIMASDPIPIVVISASVDEELRTTFRAIEEGALAVIEKPCSPTHPDFESIRRELVDTIRAMAEVPVVRRWRNAKRDDRDDFHTTEYPRKTYEVVGVASSTGGPQALHTILGSLSGRFSIPIVVVQHIVKGFIGGLVAWLRGSTSLDVRVAAHGERLLPGTVYFAPDGVHFRVCRNGHQLSAVLENGANASNFLPSADVLFESLADVCSNHAIGVVLTGMGADGAQGLCRMRQAGCHTLVQDEQSAVVYGMPGAALGVGGVDRVIDLHHIAEYLSGLTQPREVIGGRSCSHDGWSNESR